jgi:hypothetical protein
MEFVKAVLWFCIAAVAVYFILTSDTYESFKRELGVGRQQADVKTASKAILMVTWLIPGQPPQSTQTAMRDLDTCEAARQKAIAAGQTARAERTRQNEQDRAEARASLQSAAGQGGLTSRLSPEQERKLRGEPLPQVTAYCISN